MKAFIFSFLLLAGSVTLSYGQAKLPGDQKQSPTKEEQELLDLSKHK